MLALWVTSTLGWWAFAFAPLPSAPPGWLVAARVACFGATASGLPAARGWMMLVLAPATLLGAIVALWGAELGLSLRRAARSRVGQASLALLALAVVVEGVWVARKLEAARAVTAWTPSPVEAETLPEAYPRQTAPAPDFVLTDQHGAGVALAAFRGRPVVLTFVFGHCQTMCPLVVETLKRAAPDDGVVLLVTLDPWRDTPSALPGIARRWGLPPTFHVLSSRATTDTLAVARAYGVGFERNETTGDIAHPGLVFLVDAAGRVGYTFNNPPAVWVREGLRRLDRTHAFTR